MERGLAMGGGTPRGTPLHGGRPATFTQALMGNPRERMLGQQIYDEVLVSFTWPGAASLSLALVLVTVVLMFTALFATRHVARREKAS